MSDSLALQTFRLDIAVACELNMGEAAIFFAPWALLHIAISSGILIEDARLQALAVVAPYVSGHHWTEGA
jgi:hypothetical protein